MTIPGEVYAALFIFLAAIIGVGAGLIRSWGKNTQAKQALLAAETERKAAEISNAVKYEELVFKMGQQDREINLKLQNAIVETTTTFNGQIATANHQIGELSGKLAIESQARKDVESKFEVVSTQKVKAGEEVIRLQTVLKQTEKERDEYKLKLDDFLKSVGDIDAMRKQINDLTVVVEKQAREIDDLKDRESKRHEDINRFQTDALRKQVEFVQLVKERDAVKDALNEAYTINEKQAIELAELKKEKVDNGSTVGGLAEAIG